MERTDSMALSSAFYMYYGTYMLPCTHQTHKRASKKNSEWISKALSSHQRSFSVLWQVVKYRNSQLIKVQGRRVPHMGHPCHLPGSGTTGEECQSQRSGRTGGKLSSGPYEKLHWVTSAARQHSSIGRQGFRRSLALTKEL